MFNQILKHPYLWRNNIAPVLAAAIPAAASLIGTGGQIYASGKMNRKTREWNEKMYGIQRADALSDWNSQNQYNSPQQQMQRFKEAGLNPNLIYGQQNEGGVVRSTDSKSWTPDTPDLSGIGRAGSSAIQAYQDVTLQQEQVKNIIAQRRLLEDQLKTNEISRLNMAQDTLLKTANTLTAGITAETGKFDLGMKNLLMDTTIAGAKANVESIQQQIASSKLQNDLSLSANTRAEKLMQADLQIKASQVASYDADVRYKLASMINLATQNAKTKEDIENIRVIREGLKDENAVKALIKRMADKDINPNSPWFYREPQRLIEKLREIAKDPMDEYPW